jgi:UDP-glucose 4-epimerase
VTGGGSPLTQALARDLLTCPRVHSVVVAHQPGEVNPAERVSGIVDVSADLTRHRDVQTLLYGVAVSAGVDTIVHACLQPGPREHGSRAFRLNVESTRYLLSVAQEQPQIKRFVLRSFHDVYRTERHSPLLIDESQPLELAARTPQATRNHAEADLIACANMADSRLGIAVLRCADVLAAGVASPLYDYLSSRLCLRALGYDPMVNVLSLADAERALKLAVLSDVTGVFNIPGKDSLPLSELIHRAGRLGVALPGFALSPLYTLRARLTGTHFDYESDRLRFHHGGILDGSKARVQLHYIPQVSALPSAG